MAAARDIGITAIILTQDESANIAACIRCMDRLDDLVVVDSGSRDGTVQEARRARSDVRMYEHPFADFGQQRNWTLENCRGSHEWVLFVDADEFCNDALLDEIKAFVEQPQGAVGGFIAGKNYFLGRWLKHATMYPSYQLRLLKVGEVRFMKEGHGQREVTAGKLRYLRESWRHEGFSKGLHQWISRHNDYSSNEVELIRQLRREPLAVADCFNRDSIVRRRGLKRLGARLPLRPLTRFLYTYMIRRGFLDGYPGLLYCLLRVAHDIHIVAKLAEIEASERMK